MHSFIPIFTPLLNGNEKKYLNECIDTGWLGANGPFVKRLEKDFAKYIGQKYGSCVANGSAAIDVALRAMKNLYNWENDSEIIIPSFNIISAAQSCIYNRLKPVFVDAENETWNIDTSKIEEVITPKTKAIIVVHIYGLPSDMNPIMEIAKKHNIKVIEDAAQAHGLTYNNKKCGSFGEVSTFSFFSNKNVSCGEGGIILTSNQKLIEKIKYYKNLCFSEEKFVHKDLGWNYRMSNLQAAVACAQLENINNVIKKRQWIGSVYQKFLKDIPCKLSPEETKYAKNHYWAFGLVIDKNIKLSAKEAMIKLRETNIETRPFFYPMHKQPVFKKMGIFDNIKRPVSENLYEKGFYIPTGSNLKEDDLNYISEQIHLLFK